MKVANFQHWKEKITKRSMTKFGKLGNPLEKREKMTFLKKFSQFFKNFTIVFFATLTISRMPPKAGKEKKKGKIGKKGKKGKKGHFLKKFSQLFSTFLQFLHVFCCTFDNF